MGRPDRVLAASLSCTRFSHRPAWRIRSLTRGPHVCLLKNLSSRESPEENGRYVQKPLLSSPSNRYFEQTLHHFPRMDALRNGGFWWKCPSKNHRFGSSKSKSSDSTSGGDSSIERGLGRGFSFPVKQAATAASLALTGDTIAQICRHWKLIQPSDSNRNFVNVASTLLSNHDWLQALRMASYGFLLYGPGSYAWYQCLDYCLPKPTIENLSLKVLLNQIVLGPCVIAVVFAWNNLWQGKLSQLPNKYKKDALPTLLYGFRFWIPVSVLNFWVIPLHARVAFMSICSIFWNFYLSSTMSK